MPSVLRCPLITLFLAGGVPPRDIHASAPLHISRPRDLPCPRNYRGLCSWGTGCGGLGPHNADKLVTSRFAKDLAKPSNDPDVGDMEVDYEDPVFLRFQGKRVELVDVNEPVVLLHRMRVGRYSGRIELRRDDQS